MSVKVFRINSKEIIAKLRHWAENMSRNKNVLAVVLFGSLANNEATPASDADILILLKDSKERFDDRIPQFIPEKIGLSVDVFPYTLEEVRSSIKENWGIAREVMEHGFFLYGVGNTKNITSFKSWFSTFQKDY